MKKLGITYVMKRYCAGESTEETAESYIELPASDGIAQKALEAQHSNVVVAIIDRVCALQGYVFRCIQKIEEV